MKQRPIDANKLKKIYMAKGKDKLKLSTVINELEMMPTIDPVKHGKWEEMYFHEGEQGYVRDCSVCKMPQGIGLPDYCPNCGARMDGDIDED